MVQLKKIIVPGYGGSGDTHWQSHWEAASDDFSRIAPKSFDEPDLSNWLDCLDDLTIAQPSAPIIISHSLGCLMTAEYLHRTNTNVAGVFMVAVPDPDGPSFPLNEAREFAGFHRGTLRCPALIIASDNDPYAETSYAKAIAASWGAGILSIGEKEHIGDVGQWTEGHNLLTAFCSGVEASG